MNHGFCRRVMVWSWLALAISACSEDSSSKLRTVTAPSGESNILYWQDKTELFRGICPAGKPINRANCVSPMTKLAVADLTKRAMDMGKRGIDTSAAAIAAEIKALKDSDPTIVSLTSQIAALSEQKTAVQNNIATATAQINADKTLKLQIDDQIVDDNQQLSVVEQKLRSTPNDQTLIDLQRQLKSEIRQYTDRSKDVGVRIQLFQKRLTSEQTLLTKIGTDVTAKQDELKKYADTIDVDSPKLQQLKVDQKLAMTKSAAVPKVIEYIGNADVMYRGTIWPADLQGALTIVERAFGGLFLITPGNYKLEKGDANFCPQSVEITPESKLKVNFLSPCNTGVVLTCENELCASPDYSFKPVVTIIDATHYQYAQYETTKGLFVLEKPAL